MDNQTQPSATSPSTAAKFDPSFEVGREAALRGHDYFACPLTDHECRMRWADGFNSTREWWR